MILRKAKEEDGQGEICAHSEISAGLCLKICHMAIAEILIEISRNSKLTVE